MIFDTHMHSEFSFDSKMKVSEILKTQKIQNIGICLTEHVDLDLPELPLIDMEKYFEFYKKYKSSNFLIGIELGMSKINSDETITFANKYGNTLDIIIGSIHTLYNKDIFYLMEDIKLDKERVYTDYLQNILACIEDFDYFDTLGHIDYISRYATYEDKEITLEEFSPLIDKIFKTLISKNKCLELNTRRLDKEDAFNNLLKLYTRYKELGGKYVTIASDAHSQNAIGMNFDNAIKLLKYTGLIPVYFKNRKMIIIEKV
ncbi:MAG: histidinol-phosphatase HisJ family protein [Sarcina sp.]